MATEAGREAAEVVMNPFDLEVTRMLEEAGFMNEFAVAAETTKATDGEAKEEDVKLDGRLLELEDPVLLHIARQADLRTLLALEGTCRRLNVAAKEAGDFSAVRQLRFALETEKDGEGKTIDVHILITALPSLAALGSGFRFRPVGIGAHKRSVGVVDHLLSRVARPISIRLHKNQCRMWPCLERLLKDSRLPVLQSLVMEEGYTRNLEHLAAFGKTWPHLVGLDRPELGLLSNMDGTRMYSKLLYASLNIHNMDDYCDEDWNVVEHKVFIRGLRCLVVVKVVEGGGIIFGKDWFPRFVEMSTDGQLKCRHHRPKQGEDGVAMEKLYFARDDFDPAELRPLFLDHIWDLDAK